MDIRRYKIMATSDRPLMDEHTEGEYVKYEDIKTLQSDNAELVEFVKHKGDCRKGMQSHLEDRVGNILPESTTYDEKYHKIIHYEVCNCGLDELLTTLGKPSKE